MLRGSDADRLGALVAHQVEQTLVVHAALQAFSKQEDLTKSFPVRSRSLGVRPNEQGEGPLSDGTPFSLQKESSFEESFREELARLRGEAQKVFFFLIYNEGFVWKMY